MTSAAAISASYASALQQTVIVRRYTGAGPSRPRFDVSVRANAQGYQAQQLVGNIQQGDRQIIVLVADLIAAGFALPITTNDKVVEAGRELAVLDPVPRRALDGTLVAYDLRCRG